MTPDPSPAYVPDYRLREAFEEASHLDESGIEAVCPSYLELTGDEPRYQGEELLGNGATKQVFRTFDTHTKRWIALARLRPDHGPEIYDDFIHEAWLTSSLNHPNIISVHDLGVADDGRPFFTMDLKGDTTLAALIAAAEPPPLHELLGILLKVCDAVAYAHSRGTLHLDLKPENIQTQAFGEVLVCDWGLGRIIGEPQDSPPPGGLKLGEQIAGHSTLGEIKGTPGYMAPEQVIPGTRKDQRTDVFALGCLLHTLLTGHPPLVGGTVDEQMARTREACFDPPRRRFRSRNIPPALEAVFLRACARVPDERYPSVETLRQEISNYLSGYATQAEHAGFFREAWLFHRRNLAASVASLLGLVVLTVISVLFVQRLDRQRQIAAAERERSASLAGDVSHLEKLYATQSAEFRQSARDLALSFARSANSLKNIGIFTEPRKSVEEVSKLAAMALELDPECEAARVEQFDIRCNILDFKAALASPRIKEDNRYADYLKIAAVAPGFAFSPTFRPAPAELAGFLRAAAKVNPDRAPLMERIISYDSACRDGGSGYAPVVAALLAYANPDWTEDGFRYDPATHRLELKAAGGLKLAIPPGGGSGLCLIRFFPVGSLKLEIGGPLELSTLDGLFLQSLDVRDCPEVAIMKAFRLPLLREMRVRRGQFPAGRLEGLVISALPIDFIESP